VAKVRGESPDKVFLALENSIETADAVSPTMLTAMLDSKLPVQKRTTQRVFCEARVLSSAGTSTTSATLALATFHLLPNPGILRKFKMELEAAIPGVNSILTLQQVENLPYLVRASHDCLLWPRCEAWLLVECDHTRDSPLSSTSIHASGASSTQG
jgi:cytochrome P450